MSADQRAGASGATVVSRYPEIEPYEGGVLQAGDGHRIYWEVCGNPNGKPAIFLHGGPGSGCSAGQRRFFDPNAYRVVLFDQRGAGRSRPLASDGTADLRTNTTPHLIADIERLRQHQRVESWTMLGISWGSTLALAYAEAHPQRVNGLVLALVTTTSRREVQWLTHDVGRIFPQAWDRFASGVPETLRHLPLVDAYAALVFDPDPAVRERAARDWCAWEDAHVSLTPGHTPNPHFEKPEFRLRFARLVTHYWRHGAFFAEDALLRGAAVLDGIPGVLIHGRYDVSSPLETAWKLSRCWKTSRLIVLDDAGHGGGSLFIPTIIAALNEFALGLLSRSPLAAATCGIVTTGCATMR